MLPDELAAVIFTKLLLVYGTRFSQGYAGQDLATVRGHWQHELQGMPDWAVRHALEHLPADFPPNVLQFRALCNTARPPMRHSLPAPRTTPMAAPVKAKLEKVLQRMRTPQDPLSGARSLRDKERAGFHLTRAQRDFWRTALKESK